MKTYSIGVGHIRSEWILVYIDLSIGLILFGFMVSRATIDDLVRLPLKFTGSTTGSKKVLHLRVEDCKSARFPEGADELTIDPVTSSINQSSSPIFFRSLLFISARSSLILSA
jgi:hypothetical protein